MMIKMFIVKEMMTLMSASTMIARHAQSCATRSRVPRAAVCHTQPCATHAVCHMQPCATHSHVPRTVILCREIIVGADTRYMRSDINKIAIIFNTFFIDFLCA